MGGVRNLSLRARLIMAFAGVALLCCAVMGLLSARLMRHELRETALAWAASVNALTHRQFERDGLSPAAIGVDPAVARAMQHHLDQLAERLAGPDSPWSGLAVLVPEGDAWRMGVLSRVERGQDRLDLPDVFPVTREDTGEPLRTDKPARGWFTLPNGRWMGAVSPFPDGSGVLALVLAERISQDYSRQLLLLTLFAIGLSVLVGSLAAWPLASSLLRPVDAVREFTRTLRSGLYSSWLKPAGPPEIRGLLQDLNAMSVDLAEREALATRNLQLAGEVRSKDARLAAFEAVEVDFTELGDQGVLMRRMMEGITHTLPCELCAVILIDEDAWSVAHARCEPHPAIAHAARGQGMRLAGSDAEAIRRGETIQLGMLRSCGIAALAGSALADRPAAIMPLRSGAGDLLGLVLVAAPRDAARQPRGFEAQDEAGLRHFATLMAMSLERQQVTDRLLERMIRMAETRDPRETGAHVRRVSGVSVELFDGWAERRAMREEDAQYARESLRAAAMLHDVGKVGVSDTILKKPGKLDHAEYTAMKRHTILGAALLPGSAGQDEAAREVALHHHERWDGSGYPGDVDWASAGGDIERLLQWPMTGRGLAGHDIPLFARIVAVADVFDALSSPRAYKDPWPEERVLATIREDAGKAFDPELVEIFMERFDRIREIWRQHPDNAPPRA
ncbi:MAG: hypothetical protein RLZZ558_1039 [Planctomycetota bacterium]|jgi:hypothetical protein